MPFMTDAEIAEQQRQIAQQDELNAQARAHVDSVVQETINKLLELRTLADGMANRLANTLP